MDANISDLLPIQVNRKVKLVEGYIGKTESIASVQTKGGTVLSAEGLPNHILNYMAEAMNNYATLTDQQRKKLNGLPDRNKAVFTIPGKPVEYSNGNKIHRDGRGNFILATGKEYTERIRSLRTERSTIIGKFRKLVPFGGKIEIDVTFYIRKGTIRYRITHLLTATSDLLNRLGIIATETDKVLQAITGSRIVYIGDTEEEKTIVVIRW